LALQDVQPPATLLGVRVTAVSRNPLERASLKIAALVRLLLSDKPGEVAAAAQAIGRALQAVGPDIVNTLADRIERANGSALSEANMKELYDAGYSDGRRDAENKQFGSADFCNTDGTLQWHQIALYCQLHSNLLRGQEPTFINDMASRTVWHEPTEKQAKWLRSIFLRLGGRI
jgi:hypothetical protein